MSRNDLTEGDKRNSPKHAEARFEALTDVSTMHLGPPTLYYTKNKEEVPIPSLTFGHFNTIKRRRQYALFHDWTLSIYSITVVCKLQVV